MNADENWSSFAMLWMNLNYHFPWVLADDAPSNCGWKPGDSLDNFSSDYERAEEPFRGEIEAIIHDLAEKGDAVFARSDELSARSLARASKGAMFFLGIRREVVQHFLFSLDATVNGVHRTIIPFPSLDLSSVMQWLMIDWWNMHGPKFAASLRLQDLSFGES